MKPQERLERIVSKWKVTEGVHVPTNDIIWLLNMIQSHRNALLKIQESDCGVCEVIADAELKKIIP